MKSKDNYPKFISRWNGRFYRALITKDFVFFVNFQEGDENACCEMYRRVKSNPHDRDNSGLELVSNNYFANVGLTEELAKGKDNWEYISPTMKVNYNLAVADGFFEDWNAM
jgi:hypothetical protein